MEKYLELEILRKIIKKKLVMKYCILYFQITPIDTAKNRSYVFGTIHISPFKREAKYWVLVNSDGVQFNELVLILNTGEGFERKYCQMSGAFIDG